MLVRALFLFALLAPANLLSAETHLTFQSERVVSGGGESKTFERRVEAWAGEAGASLDSEDFTWLYQAAAQRLLLIDHGAKTYQVFQLPFSAVDFQPESQREAYLGAQRSLEPQSKLEGPGAAETVEGHSARRYLATITLAGWGVIEIEAWISPDLGERCASLKGLLAARTVLNSLYGEIERQILDLPGCTVRRIVRQFQTDVQATTVQRLVAVRDEPAEPGRYAPPSGYREVPIDPRIVGGFFPAQPLPSQ